jgi:4-alpha-glucanotransferase
MRDPDTLIEELKRREAGVMRQIALQLIFDEQWDELRRYADRRGVQLIGDVPIFVMGDGCDTWVNRELFELNDDGRPSVVTGVPPDYFSPTGQLWGNPHYRWSAHAETDFAWWKLRLSRVLRHVHRARIDHFRGLSAAWTVPITAETAMEGYWTPGPGKALFDALGPLPLIAEDLGIITEDVNELRQHIGAPGMKVLQFAFGSDATPPLLAPQLPRSQLGLLHRHPRQRHGDRLVPQRARARRGTVSGSTPVVTARTWPGISFVWPGRRSRMTPSPRCKTSWRSVARPG